jgi:hypothetical protein
MRIWRAILLGLCVSGPAISAGETKITRSIYRDRTNVIDANPAPVAPVVAAPTRLREDRPLWDAGGWVSTSFLSFSELDHDPTARDSFDDLYVLDTRLWTQWSNGPRKQAYVRVRKITLEIQESPGASLPDTKDLQAVDLDIGYLQLPVGDLDLSVGRQLKAVGRGLALSQILDGATLTYHGDQDEAFLFAGDTTPRAASFDPSIEGYDEGVEDRLFYGAQWTHLGGRGERLYVYAFDQRDHTQSQSILQNRFEFDYDAQFAGVGAEAPLGTWGRYFGELIGVTGNTFASDPVPARQAVRAWAFDGAVYGYLKDRMNTTLSLGYSVASGVEGRRSVTSRFGGRDIVDDKDTLFVGFGRFEGGLALSPQFSNIRVTRLGLETKPFEGMMTPPADLQLSLYLRNYRKYEEMAAISDIAASNPDPDLGNAADLVVAWRATSDLSILAVGGLFVPGDAFPTTADKETRAALVTATLNF